VSQPRFLFGEKKLAAVWRAPGQLDREWRYPYNKRFTVMHFSDLMNFSSSPAGTCRAALFYGAHFRAHILLT
jgi:hypothetical protein